MKPLKPLFATLGLIACAFLPAGILPSEAHAEPPAQFDGGIVVYQSTQLTADDGTWVTLKALASGHADAYLEVDGYLYVTDEVFAGSYTFTDDADCLNWPTAGTALCTRVNAGTLGTIQLVTPFSLEVWHVIDAGTLLEQGAHVVTTHGLGAVHECHHDVQMTSGTVTVTFDVAFSSSALTCPCSDTDNPTSGCGAVSKSSSAVTLAGNSNDHIDFCCDGPR